MRPDPMKSMILCFGQCDDVPDRVYDAVLASLKRIPGDGEDQRDARAADLAPRMAVEGWRFCTCFPMVRTQQHELIFNLVHTTVANRLADEAARARAA